MTNLFTKKIAAFYDGPGFTRLRVEGDGTPVRQVLYRPQADVTLAQTQRLLAHVHGSIHLEYFDAAHPSVSDPGAYMEIYRRGEAMITFARNHGWSGGATVMEEQALAENLWKNSASPTAGIVKLIWEHEPRRAKEIAATLNETG